MKVWVARYMHDHGVDVRVFKTEDSAERWRQDIAEEWWGYERQGIAMPDDPRVRADEYFEAVNDREYFKTTETIVED